MKAMVRWSVLGCLLCMVAPALGFECAFKPQETELTKLAVLPTEVEIGQWAVRALASRHGVAAEPKLVQRVAAVADRLRPVVRKRPDLLYTVEVLNTREKGACAYPGGYVVLTKGLIELTADDAELALVIAHEFAHIATGHMDRPIEHELPARLEQRLTEIGARGRGFADELRQRFCQTMAGDEIRKVNELQADEHAIVYVHLAGYNPAVAYSILDKIGAYAASSCQPSREERKARIAQQVQGITEQIDKFQAGVRFYVQQEYERAIEAFQTFLSVYQGREVHHNLATAYHRLALRAQEPTSQLQAKCSLALESETQAKGLRLRTANRREAQEAFQRYLAAAIEQYQHALKQDPQYAPAATNLACAYLAQAKYGYARDDLEGVLRARPTYAPAYNNLGVALLLQGDRARAVAHFEQAIRHAPRYADPHCNLARVWEAERQIDRARAAWQRYLDLGGNGQNTCARLARSQLGLAAGHEPASTQAQAEQQAAPVWPGQALTVVAPPEHEVSLSPRCTGPAERSCPSVRLWRYDRRGLTVLVEGQVITQVVLTSPATQTTAKGVRIGTTEAQVRGSYGAPTRLEETPTGRYLVYDQARLAFAVAEEKVTSWFLFP